MKIFVLEYKVDFHLPKTQPFEHRMLVVAPNREIALKIGRQDMEDCGMRAIDWKVLSEHKIEEGFKYRIF